MNLLCVFDQSFQQQRWRTAKMVAEFLEEHAEELGETVVVNVYGRRDKDLETVLEENKKRDLDGSLDISVLGQIQSRDDH